MAARYSIAGLATQDAKRPRDKLGTRRTERAARRHGASRYSLDFRLSTMSIRRSLPRMASATMPENTMVSANAMAKLAAWMSRPNMT